MKKKISTVDEGYDDGDGDGDERATYISFSSNNLNGFEEKKPFLVCDHEIKQGKEFTMNKNYQSSAASSEFSNNFDDDWDNELRSIVDFAFDPFFSNNL